MAPSCARSPPAPVLVVPISRDQPDNAARVVHHGVGAKVSPRSSVDTFRREIERLLDDATVQERTLALAHRMRPDIGAPKALATLTELTDGTHRHGAHAERDARRRLFVRSLVMRDGTCGRCGATTVHAASNGISFGGSDRAGLRPHLEPGFRGAVRLHQTDLWSFACTTCGSVELFVLDPTALQYVAAHWPPAVPPA